MDVANYSDGVFQVNGCDNGTLKEYIYPFPITNNKTNPFEVYGIFGLIFAGLICYAVYFCIKGTNEGRIENMTRYDPSDYSGTQFNKHDAKNDFEE